MKIRSGMRLFELFPAASIHGIVIDRIDTLPAVTVEAWRVKSLESVQERQINPELLFKEPEVAEWRKVYQEFGVKPSRYRSSIESLLKRVVRGDMIHTPIPFVNLYCSISVIARVPMGAYDLDKIQGPISVRLSELGEEFIGIGEREVWKTNPGMVVYADESGVICWAWNHRDSARTSLDQKTKRTIVFADSATTVSRDRANKAIELLLQALKGSLCKPHSRFVIDREHPEHEVHL